MEGWAPNVLSVEWAHPIFNLKKCTHEFGICIVALVILRMLSSLVDTHIYFSV